jgi:putative oxidoreductase
VGGALIAAGLLTPVGSALITGVMTQAIKSVHAGEGPWFTEGGWEYNVVLIAAVFAIAEQGPGDWSLDHALHTERSGPLWATAAVGAGRRRACADHTRPLLIAAAAGLPV